MPAAAVRAGPARTRRSRSSPPSSAREPPCQECRARPARPREPGQPGPACHRDAAPRWRLPRRRGTDRRRAERRAPPPAGRRRSPPPRPTTALSRRTPTPGPYRGPPPSARQATRPPARRPVRPLLGADAPRRVARLSAVGHPHLAAVGPVAELADGSLAVLTEEVPGTDLESVCAGKGRWSAGEVVTVVVPLAEALAALHDAGLCHGDVAAANVVLRPDGRPVLVDLVLA